MGARTSIRHRDRSLLYVRHHPFGFARLFHLFDDPVQATAFAEQQEFQTGEVDRLD